MIVNLLGLCPLVAEKYLVLNEGKLCSKERTFFVHTLT